MVIPSYNAARYLPAALGSVLPQGDALREVLVVDDGSTDDTRAIVMSHGPRVRYIYQPNRGVSAARNLGIAESCGRYVAFLDADDTWLPGKLSRQAAALRRAPECGLCYSALLVVDCDLNVLGVRRTSRKGSALEDLLTRGNFVGSTSPVLCERSLLERVGGFEVTLSQCADWDLWIRLAAVTEFLYLDDPLVTYRQHSSNMSRDARLLEKDSVRVLEKGFALAGLPRELRARKKQAFGRNDAVLAGSYFQAGLWRDFARCAARAFVRDPRQSGRFLAYPIRAARRRMRRHGP